MRRLVDFFQRVFKLAIGNFQLGQFENERITAL